MTLKEVICINIGQAGVQLANATWELLCAEHGIKPDGRRGADESTPNSFQTFFEKVPSGNYVPRALNIDLEPTVIDEMRSGVWRQLWHPNHQIAYLEDASNNFARGYLTIGDKVIDRCVTQLQKLVHNCDGLQGFFIMNSYGGGTGSGLSTLILDQLRMEFPKDPKFQMVVFPSSEMSSAIVEPYNSVFTCTNTIDSTDVVTVFDNQTLYNICERQLGITKPVYSNLNRLISQIFSNMTVSIRYSSALQHDLTQMQTNLIPYPKMHFPITNFAPIFDASRSEHETLDAADLTQQLFAPQNQFVNCNLQSGKYMSCCLQYRGHIMPSEVSQALTDIKNSRDVQFVDWCPTGFKVGINAEPPTVISASQLAPTHSSATMFCNSTAISQAWLQLLKKFRMLYHKRSFIHWYTKENWEEPEFVTSMTHLSTLITDYESVAEEKIASLDTQDLFENEQIAQLASAPAEMLTEQQKEARQSAQRNSKNDHQSLVTASQRNSKNDHQSLAEASQRNSKNDHQSLAEASQRNLKNESQALGTTSQRNSKSDRESFRTASERRSSVKE